MVRFLSAEWLDRFSEAAGAAAAPDRDDRPVCLQHVVRDTPEGEVRYWLRLSADGLRAQAGTAADPDVVLITDYEGAYGLHRGAVSAQELAAAGRLKLTGHVERLRDLSGALAGLGDPFAALSAATTAAD